MDAQLKPWQEQNYYEILEVGTKATEEEIRVAYDKLKAIYSPSSSGMTLLFTPEEVKEIHDKVEEAYRVLRDLRSQREYDLVLRGEGEMTAIPAPNPIVARQALSPQQIEEALGGNEVHWSGANLSKVRRYLSLEIDEVAGETKIGKHNLQAIEEEDVRVLPAPVYLKGFLRGYARALGLDQKQVTDEYLAGIMGKGYKRD
ncbi:MAG: helix-turn-helix domain-containing protein [Desulfobacterales bacterium]|nr:helix-turn-helix domain-containing protein [Desulfobacterales bacterium]